MITITTKHDSPLFDPLDHREQAADKLGVETDDIHCTAAGPDTFEVISEAVYSDPHISQDGTLLKAAELIQERVISYHRNTTWELKPVVQRDPEPEPYKEPEIPWPTLRLSRGAKWHGAVTIAGVTGEHTFISDGVDLVLIESPEGEAVLKALEVEHAAHQAATSG